jgi:hypothetical protein
MTFIGKRVHHDWSARSAPDTGIKRRYDPSTFARQGDIRARFCCKPRVEADVRPSPAWFSFPTSSTLDDVK